MPVHCDDTFLLGGDLPVRRLGFGTGGLVGAGYWGPRGTRAEARTLLRAAVERGVTLIDTADNYGPVLAEELVAEALHPYGEGLVVSTKGGVVRTGPDQWHPAGRPEQLRAMCEASLSRLRLERIGHGLPGPLGAEPGRGGRTADSARGVPAGRGGALSPQWHRRVAGSGCQGC